MALYRSLPPHCFYLSSSRQGGPLGSAGPDAEPKCLYYGHVNISMLQKTMFKLPFQCMKRPGILPFKYRWPHELLAFFFQGLNIFVIELVEIIIDSYTVIRKI